MLRIYVASSWKNERQPEVVRALREAGHTVYDFRNPRPGNHGFAWSEIDDNWEKWDAPGYLEALETPIAEDGFQSDMQALAHCDVCVLVLPAGLSAGLEAGFAAGWGKTVLVLHNPGIVKAELMVKMADGQYTSLQDVVAACNDASETLGQAFEGSAPGRVSREPPSW